MTATSASAPDLSLDAATPLVTLSPDLVALIVGRVQAGLTAFGPDHPRTPITRRIVLPSAAIAVLDAVGLVVAAATGRVALVVVAAVLLAVLAYLAVAGARFVRTDPLRVTAEQRARVDTAKTWRSKQAWTSELRSSPWGPLVTLACRDVARIAASDAWTWASIAGHRVGTELGYVLDGVDREAFAFSSSASSTAEPAGAALVRRVGALRCVADSLDDLVRRAVDGADVRDELPDADDRRLAELLTLVRMRE